MNIIKALFKKELINILAPLDTIEKELLNFIDNSAIEIEETKEEVNELLAKISTKTSDRDSAVVVKQNIKNLLGKL